MIIATKRLKIFIEPESLIVVADGSILYNVNLSSVTRLIYPDHASVLFHIFNNDLNLLMRFCEDITEQAQEQEDMLDDSSNNSIVSPIPSPYDAMGDIEPEQQDKLL